MLAFYRGANPIKIFLDARSELRRQLDVGTTLGRLFGYRIDKLTGQMWGLYGVNSDVSPIREK